MEAIIFLILGVLVALLITQRPVKIEIKHTNENIFPTVDPIDMDKIEKSMDNKQEKTDDIYDKMGEINENISKIFGGSDKI